MTTLRSRPLTAKSRPALADDYEWLTPITPAGFGLLRLVDQVYAIREEHFEYETGQAGRLWDLCKPDGTHYRLTLDADGDLACDCPHSCYRPDAPPCKHRRLLPLALADADRRERLAAFLAPDRLGVEPVDAPF